MTSVLAVGIDRERPRVFASMEGIRCELTQPFLANATLAASATAVGVPDLAQAGEITPLNGAAEAFAQISGPASGGASISLAPVYHITIAGDAGPDQEERFRETLREHEREQILELESLLND